MHFSDGLCNLCRNENENVEHLFIKCEYVKNVWENIEMYLKLYRSELEQLTDFIKIVGILNADNSFEEVNMILGLVRREIWKSRCRDNYDGANEKHRNLIANVHFSIKNHISILLHGKKSKYTSNIERLQKIFGMS